MVRTGETTESVNYAAIGPRYIAIVLYKNLLARKLMDNTGLVEFYKQRTLKLQYDIYHKPARRRILGDIQLLHEELSAVLATRKAQTNAVCHFGWIGNAKTYRISNQSRNQQYYLEVDVGQACVNQLHDEMNDLISYSNVSSLSSRKFAIASRCWKKITARRFSSSQSWLLCSCRCPSSRVIWV